MKALKSFSTWIHRVFSATVKTAFPTLAVKYLTLKNTKKPYDFLPGKEKELEAIKTLGLIDEDLKMRTWSSETRQSLIQSGEMAIITDISSDTEFALVLKARNEGAIAAAMRGYTPSKTRLIEMFNSLNEKQMLSIISDVPKAFDALSSWEVMGVAKERAYYGAQRWDYANALVNKQSSWAVKFMDEVMKIPPQRLNEAAKAAFKNCFNVAYTHSDIDVSSFMPYMYVFWPEEYKLMRDKFNNSKRTVGAYVKVMLPQLVKYLTKEVEPSMGQNPYEAKIWLDIALSHLNEDEVYNCVMENFYAIESHTEDPETIYRALYCAASSAERLALILDKFPKVWLPKLRHAFVSSKDCVFHLKKFFPFTGWKEEDSEKAVKLLIWNESFPMDRLSELTDKLQEVAIEVSEIASEFAAIDRGALCSLVDVKLHPASESKFLSAKYTYVGEKLAYINNFELSDEGFNTLVTVRGYYGDDTEKYPELIIAYAEKWGLSEKKYQLLLAGRHACLAPQLRRYLKLKETSKGAAIVINEPDDDEIPEG